MEQMKARPKEMTYVILQAKDNPVCVKTWWAWWKWGESWPFSQGYMRSEEARGLRMAITMPCSANHHQGEETPLVKYGIDFKMSESAGRGHRCEINARCASQDTCNPSTWETEAGGSYFWATFRDCKRAGLSQLSGTRLSHGQSSISGHMIIGSARIPTVRGIHPSRWWLRILSINTCGILSGEECVSRAVTL